MPITVTSRDSALTIALSGEIDHHGAREMMTQLEDAIGGSLRVTNIPTQARRVLDAAGVGRLITLD